MKAHGVVLVIAITAAVAALWPAAGGAATLRGVVVARQHGTLLVASPAGVLTAVRGHASIGARLAGTRVVGTAKRATIRGVVVRRLGRTLILSSDHHLIAVPNRVGRALAGTTPAPAPGTVVSAGVSIANGEIEQEDEDDIGRVDASSVAVQATISAVGAGTVTLNVQGQTLTVPLPGGLTLPASLVGQTVTIDLSLTDDNANDQGDDDGGSDHGGHSGHGHGGDDGGDDG
jgi:hypothetical protein